MTTAPAHVHHGTVVADAAQDSGAGKFHIMEIESVGYVVQNGATGIHYAPVYPGFIEAHAAARKLAREFDSDHLGHEYEVTVYALVHAYRKVKVRAMSDVEARAKGYAEVASDTNTSDGWTVMEELAEGSLDPSTADVEET